ncbi:MAG: M56 family metallopeptidase [Aminipila sp.]
MSNQWLISILEISLATSVIILIVKLFSSFLNKHYAAKWKKWIWLIIAIRLLIPVNFSFPLTPVEVNITDINDLYPFSSMTEISEGTNTMKQAGKEVLPAMASNVHMQAENLNDKATEKHGKFISWMDITIFVWGIGCTAFIAYYIVGYLYFRKQILRWSRVLKNQNVHNIITSISNDINIKRQFDVYACDKIASPSLMGLIHPILVIPSVHYSDEELTFIFKHELTHYRRYDLWYKMLLLLVNAVHWFNPLIYLFRNEAYIALELSCDDEVIKGMSTNFKRAYGKTILSCINQQKLRQVALTTCFNDNTKTLKERLQNILCTRKKSNGFIIILIILLLTGSIGSTVVFAFDEHKPNVTDGFTWHGETNLIPKGLKLPEELIKDDNDWNKFLDSDRRIALVAEIPEEDIYVYGLKENGKEKGSYTLHGVCVRQGKDIQILDLFWGVYGDIPKLQYEDYDNDGIKELAMILRSANGTGIDLNDLHIFERTNTNGWTDYLFSSVDWADIINNKLEYQVQDGTLTIAINGEDTGDRIDLSSLEKEWGGKLNSVHVGNVGEFTFKDGKIYLQVLPAGFVANWATEQVITDKYVQMEVLYHGGFKLKNAFVSDNNN